MNILVGSFNLSIEKILKMNKKTCIIKKFYGTKKAVKVNIKYPQPSPTQHPI